MRSTSETEALFAILAQLAAPEAANAISLSVRESSDRDLCRINALDFAAKRKLDEEKTIAALLHAAELGLFEMNWNVLCPGCGGVLETNATLKTVSHEEYTCPRCAWSRARPRTRLRTWRNPPAPARPVASRSEPQSQWASWLQCAKSDYKVVCLQFSGGV